MPNESNKKDITRLTDETRPNRQKELNDYNKQLTLATIFKTYPRFKDYHGELIQREFIALFPDNDSFLGKFATYYAPRILELCSKPHLPNEVDDLEDDNLKALVLLPELLPSPNYMKKRTVKGKSNPTAAKAKAKSIQSHPFSARKIPNMNLLQYIHSSDDLFERSKINDSSKSSNKKVKNVQPFLLCNMSGHEREGNFFIKVDGNLIPVGDNAMMGFDTLLKLHYCFGVEFSPDLVNFYDFITECIMKLNEPRACCVACNATINNVIINSRVNLNGVESNDDQDTPLSSSESDYDL